METVTQTLHRLTSYETERDWTDTEDDPRVVHDLEVNDLNRGSQRLMDGTKTLRQEVLVTCMTAAMRGIEVPQFVVVHDVTEVPSGLYRWPNLTEPLRAEDLRDELYEVCLEQVDRSRTAHLTRSFARDDSPT